MTTDLKQTKGSGSVLDISRTQQDPMPDNTLPPSPGWLVSVTESGSNDQAWDIEVEEIDEETAEILMDPVAMAMIEESEREISEGRGISGDEVRRQLGH